MKPAPVPGSCGRSLAQCARAMIFFFSFLNFPLFFLLFSYFFPSFFLLFFSFSPSFLLSFLVETPKNSPLRLFFYDSSVTRPGRVTLPNILGALNKKEILLFLVTRQHIRRTTPYLLYDSRGTRPGRVPLLPAFLEHPSLTPSAYQGEQ